MMEANSSAVDVHTTTTPPITLSVTLSLSPDPTRDYTDVLRDIVDLAFEASASIPVEIIIVDPADSQQAISDEVINEAHAPVAAITAVDKQMRRGGTGYTRGQRHTPRLETRAVAV